MEANEPEAGSIESALAKLLQEPEEMEAEEVDEDVESEEESDEESDESDEDIEDSEDTEEDGDDESEPELFTVKVDGKEQQVTLDELKQGFSGQAYVRKGMEQAAQQRKQAEEVYAALLNERQQIAQLFQQIQQGGMPTPPKMPTKEMFDSDPIGYLEAKLSYDEQKAAFDQQIGQMQQVVQQQSQAAQAAQAAHLQREMEILKQSIPEFNDEKQGRALREKLVSSGQKIYGYTVDELGAISDHRAVRVLTDAIRYREMMDGKTKMEASAKPKQGKVLKAGAKKVGLKSQAERQARQKLRKTGSLNDAVSLILN